MIVVELIRDRILCVEKLRYDKGVLERAIEREYLLVYSV